jgi:peptidoglycan/LPS O-acetylase OafA/YrhL
VPCVCKNNRFRTHNHVTARLPSFRPDIQGLRAVAVVFVMAFHAFPSALPGGFVGVDMFFVVSGFLITGLLVREREATGRIGLANFYVRRIKRLLPAATLVLVVVALGSLYWLPIIRWRETAHQVLASAGYVQNWLLLQNAIDYWAEDTAPSPVVHYWSLSIEEQFYLVWPWLLALVAWLAAKAKRGQRSGVAVVAGAIFVASLGYSVSYSNRDPAAAYFSTWTRAWELSLGALTYLAFDWVQLRLSRRALGVVGWLGLLGVGAAPLVIRPSMMFPGWVALLPTLSCALLLLAGPGKSKLLASGWLATRPLELVGNLSYSLYLWHWPPLVFFAARYGREPLPSEAGLILMGVLGLALATHVCVEAPLWRSRIGAEHPTRGFALGAVCVAVALLAGRVPLAEVAAIEATPMRAPGAAQGALAFLDAEQQHPLPGGTEVAFVPLPLDAKEDIPLHVGQGCHVGVGVEEPKPCNFGDQGAGQRVVLVGDSHAAQWLPALLALAKVHRLSITTITKTSCPLTDELVSVGRRQRRPYRQCQEWNRRLAPMLVQMRPALIITAQSSDYAVVGAADAAESERRLAGGLKRSWQYLTNHGLPVLGIRDTPTMGFDVADCAARYPRELVRCSLPRARALAGVDSTLQAAEGTQRALVADLSDYICTRDTCPAVVGGVLVYRDGHHLTATYAQSLAPLLWPYVGKALSL